MDDQVLDEFMVGDVISKAFTTLFRNILPFTTLGVLIYAPFFIILLFAQEPTTLTDADSLTTYFYTLGLSFAFFIVALFVMYGAISFGTIRDLQGEPATFGEIISKGFSRFFPVLGVAIVSTIVIIMGFMLLIIPGIIIAMIIYVAVPVVIIERAGVFESLTRSADLTSGYRWKIFGIYLLVFLINMGLGIVQSIFAFGGVVVVSVVTILTSALSMAFGAVVVAVAYQELRRVKEGADIDSIASVFS